MYFSAACLIGLRPLFSYMPRWAKDRVMHKSDVYGTTLTGNRRGGTPLKHMHQSGMKMSSLSMKRQNLHNVHSLSRTASSPSPPLLVAGDEHATSNHYHGNDYSGGHSDFESAVSGGKSFLHDFSPEHQPAFHLGENNSLAGHENRNIRIETRIEVDSTRNDLNDHNSLP